MKSAAADGILGLLLAKDFAPRRGATNHPKKAALLRRKQRQIQILGGGGAAAWGLLECRVATMQWVLRLAAVENLLGNPEG